MVAKHINNLSFMDIYMWSIYWAGTIMLTIGFGDITPVTKEEAIVVFFIELFSCIILGYNISEIGSIITKIRESMNNRSRKLGIIKRMSIQTKIPLKLQREI
jgi:hypothetical protein